MRAPPAVDGLGEGGEHAGHVVTAAAAAGGGAGAGGDVGDGVRAGQRGGAELAGGDAVAAADGVVVGQVGGILRGDTATRADAGREDQRSPVRRGEPGPVEELRHRANGLRTAEHDRAGDALVADDDLLVHATGRVGKAEHFQLLVQVVHVRVAHRGQIDVGRLQPGDQPRP
jgi:hypothetical protein